MIFDGATADNSGGILDSNTAVKHSTEVVVNMFDGSYSNDIRNKTPMPIIVDGATDNNIGGILSTRPHSNPSGPYSRTNPQPVHVVEGATADNITGSPTSQPLTNLLRQYYGIDSPSRFGETIECYQIDDLIDLINFGLSPSADEDDVAVPQASRPTDVSISTSPAV